MNRPWTYYLPLFVVLSSVVFALSYVGTKLYFQESSVSTDELSEVRDEGPILQRTISSKTAVILTQMRDGRRVYNVTGTRVGGIEQLGAAVRTGFVIDGDSTKTVYTVDFLPSLTYGGVYKIAYYPETTGELDYDVENADAGRLREVLRSANKIELRMVIYPSKKKEQAQQVSILKKLYEGVYPDKLFVFLPEVLLMVGPKP